ncbi:MAG TPA: hypothetical protein PLB27_12765, partial [Bacteroidales bacterium]|nr:hypothetical protein [Bacteroidales bacterium]
NASPHPACLHTTPHAVKTKSTPALFRKDILLRANQHHIAQKSDHNNDKTQPVQIFTVKSNDSLLKLYIGFL